MFDFQGSMFNQQFMNCDYYQANNLLIQQKYQREQSEHVMKAVHAFSDMLDEVKHLDIEHQEQVFFLCLEEMAKKNGWR